MHRYEQDQFFDIMALLGMLIPPSTISVLLLKNLTGMGGWWLILCNTLILVPPGFLLARYMGRRRLRIYIEQLEAEEAQRELNELRYPGV